MANEACKCEWKDIIKFIMPYVSSPKDEFNRPTSAMIQSFVRRIAYDFARRSGALRKTTYFDLDCGVCDYNVGCLGEDVFSYKQVKINGVTLGSREYEIRNDVLFLESQPTQDIIDGICIDYSYAPCEEFACDVPPEYCTRYREALIAGTLAELLCMPNMDWFSVAAAEKFRRRYEDYISMAKVDVRKRASSRRKNIFDMETRFIR